MTGTKYVPGKKMKTATCRNCGCTDLSACPGGCSWIEVNYRTGNGLCSRCAPSGRGTIKLLILIPILAIAIAGNASAVGKRETFLAVGPGSAGTALGSALVSRGVDSSAGYYNPATLVGLPSSVLIQYDQPENASRSWLAMTAGDRRMKVGLLWKNETLPLSSGKNGFLLSAGVSEKLIPFMPAGTSLGLTLGYVSEKIASYSANSILANAGFSWSAQGTKFRYGTGIALNNIYFSGLQFRPDGEKEVWPKELVAGAFVSRWNLTALLSAKVEDKVYPSAGLLYAPFSMFELRAGYDTSPHIGAGFEIKKFRLDYAFPTDKAANS